MCIRDSTERGGYIIVIIMATYTERDSYIILHSHMAAYTLTHRLGPAEHKLEPQNSIMYDTPTEVDSMSGQTARLLMFKIQPSRHPEHKASNIMWYLLIRTHMTITPRCCQPPRVVVNTDLATACRHLYFDWSLETRPLTFRPIGAHWSLGQKWRPGLRGV